MKLVSALFIGVLSASLVLFMTMWIMIATQGAPSYPGTLIGVFTGAWLITVLLVSRGARSPAKVWARGSLLGAAEWLAFGFITVLSSAHTLAISRTPRMSNAEVLGAGLWAGFTTFLGLVVGLFMAIFCLVTWFVAKKMQDEFTNDDGHIERDDTIDRGIPPGRRKRLFE